MNIRVLGMNCPSCVRMKADVESILAHRGWEAHMEYVSDAAEILRYGVMSTPVLVVNDQVVMVGHRGAARIEAVLGILVGQAG